MVCSLILALCAILVIAAYEWHAYDGRCIAAKGNSVPDLRDAEAWATQLDRDLCDHWETPRAVAVAVRAAIQVNAVRAVACVVEASPLPKGGRRQPIAMRLGTRPRLWPERVLD